MNTPIRHYRAEGDLDLVSYSELAAQSARDAIHRLGWTRLERSPEHRNFVTVFPKATPPFPIQEAVEALADRIAHQSAFVVIEAPMGEGKFLADRLGGTAGQEGTYLALPTQATSNQAFSRVREFLVSRHPGQIVNLQLLHGHASLSAEFETLRAADNRVFEPSGIDDEAVSGTPDV